MSRRISLHADPSNKTELMKSMPNNANELIAFAGTNFPGWIINIGPQFSIDLFKFNEHWAYTCVQIGTIPQKVILVTEAYLDLQTTTHTLIAELCKRLTTNGFVVVDSINFALCGMCKEVIVSEKRIQDSKLRWSGMCQGCYKYDPRK
jgi:hypothetical protein